MPSMSALRLEQTLSGIDWLHGQIGTWVERRHRLDPRGQYRTQVSSLGGTLTRALTRAAALAPEATTRAPGDAFEYLRELDGQVTVIRRLWRWYADKFDQRDDPHEAVRKTVAAADEVVWAIHAEVYQAAGAETVPPAPLPYLDALVAPEAILADEPPQSLRPDPDFDAALAVLLGRLPVPIVALPAEAAVQPWTLVLLGHEVGHHLQYGLAPHLALVQSVGKAVSAAAGGGEAGTRWRSWSRELFADLSGLVTMGPSVVAALLPYEWGGDAWLRSEGRDSYPPPLVRLAMLAALADRLGLRLPPGLVDADAVHEDLRWVPAVAAALVATPVAAGGTLADLADFTPAEFAPAGPVATRGQALLADGGVHETGLSAVRRLTSAGMVAWQELAGGDGADRRPRAQRLATTLVDRIVAARPGGTRAAAGTTVVTADEELLTVLRSAR